MTNAESGSTLKDLVSAISDEYEVDEATATADIRELLETLIERKVIRIEE